MPEMPSSCSAHSRAARRGKPGDRITQDLSNRANEARRGMCAGVQGPEGPVGMNWFQERPPDWRQTSQSGAVRVELPYDKHALSPLALS
jgi:hypothetical protein